MDTAARLVLLHAVGLDSIISSAQTDDQRVMLAFLSGSVGADLAQLSPRPFLLTIGYLHAAHLGAEGMWAEVNAVA